MMPGTPREVGQLSCIVTARKNLQLVLSERQREVLIGTILGDGYIYPQGKIQIEQSEKQRDYLCWKYDELRSLVYSPPQFVSRYDRRTGKTYQSHRFWIRQYFRPWREEFYQDKQKVFPYGIVLTPLILAVWYMEDRSYRDYMCTLSTESYNKESLIRIQEALYKHLSINTFIRVNGKLAVEAKDHKRFFAIMRDFIHPTMHYKCLDPLTTEAKAESECTLYHDKEKLRIANMPAPPGSLIRRVKE